MACRCFLLGVLGIILCESSSARKPFLHSPAVRGLSAPGLLPERRIPRVIYQTWVSKLIPLGFQIVRSRMLKRNPGYRVVMFDDADIDAFVTLHYKGTDVERAFRKLDVGAARADLWRYLILFREGGYYLDLDSEIVASLDQDLVRPEDGAVVSREANRYFMCQYFLAFEAGHPILARVIELATQSILNPHPISHPGLHVAAPGAADSSAPPLSATPAPRIDPWLLDPLLYLAGPPVFNRAVDLEARDAIAADSKAPALPSSWNVWDATDEEVNAAFAAAGVRARLYGNDFEGAIVFKHEYSKQMGWFKPHWRDDGDSPFLQQLLIGLGVAVAAALGALLATSCGRAAMTALLFRGGPRKLVALAAALLIPALCWAVLRGYIQVIY